MSVVRSCVVCILWVAALAASHAAPKLSPAWGPAADGLTMGVDEESTPEESRLRIHFRNVSPNPMAFHVGGSTGDHAMYTVEITATSPDGKRCRLLNTTVGLVAGYVDPIVVRLAAASVHFISIDLKKLMCATKDSSVSLDALLDQGYSVSAAFTATTKGNSWAQVPDGWTGSVTSGTFHRETPKQPARKAVKSDDARSGVSHRSAGMVLPSM
jgi:hypothetical protein